MPSVKNDSNMKISLDKLCRVFSHALDIIEEEQIGASEHHSMRTAALCSAMGKQFGFNDDAISSIAISALFHDNALTEYHLSEKIIAENGENLLLHCRKGQDNVAWLPFENNAKDIILYHHEKPDGSGPFGKHEGEYPLEAELLAVADSVDVTFQLQHIQKKNLPALRGKIAANAHAFSTKKAVEALLDVLDINMLECLRDENIYAAMDSSLPRWDVDISDSSVSGIASFTSHIIDYKSKFTRKHSSQIANRAWLMSDFYGKDIQERNALYLAASLHDLGKIATPVQVLEKPGKLDHDEFNIIKAHVRHTHDWLGEIPGFETIRNWAADHHEKLDGSGYTFGKSADELDFNARLMACIDIYQAVCEQRPYHDARSHEDTMPILYSMAEKGFIDKDIVRDLDEAMNPYSLRDIPSPFK